LIWTAVWFFLVLAILFWGLTFFLSYFFRDPERHPPENEHYILSPADGRVISIEKVTENEFLHDTVNKISIFMSPLNVHINRVPINGRVQHYRYKKGKFFAAYKPESSAENEQTVIGIQNGEFKLLFKQIAGVLARRIVCNLQEGDTVKQGVKFGLIKLGSRVDIFFPVSVKIRIEMNQQVTAGESILGEI
jgi:phosphatidylserine decarboxylase